VREAVAAGPDDDLAVLLGRGLLRRAGELRGSGGAVVEVRSGSGVGSGNQVDVAMGGAVSASGAAAVTSTADAAEPCRSSNTSNVTSTNTARVTSSSAGSDDGCSDSGVRFGGDSRGEGSSRSAGGRGDNADGGSSAGGGVSRKSRDAVAASSPAATAAAAGTAAGASGSVSTCCCPQCGYLHDMCLASGGALLGGRGQVSEVMAPDGAGEEGECAVGVAECRACGMAGLGAQQQSLLLCSGCMVVRYCGKDCQRGDWKRHRKICKRVQLQQQQQQSTSSNSSCGISR
jgi:hypothetical protein